MKGALKSTKIGFLPTPSARRATYKPGVFAATEQISTHALREEGDLSDEEFDALPQTISTHALREEGDGRARYPDPAHGLFLPTPSARRATQALQIIPDPTYISTHALREEGDILELCAFDDSPISTHALREEGDSC